MKSKIHEFQKSIVIAAGKKLFLTAIFFTSVFVQTGSAQDTASRPSELLTQYYLIKDALVAGNAVNAAAGAGLLVKTLNGIDYKIISEGNINMLLKDAGIISESKDIKIQRERFANLSSNIVALAKTMKLSDQPVYEVYCPMKKASWLSSEKAIRNPYYGNAMLTCGKITATL